MTAQRNKAEFHLVCVCGGSMKGSVSPPTEAAVLQRIFWSIHGDHDAGTPRATDGPTEDE